MTTRCAAAGVFSLLLLPFRSSTAAKPNILVGTAVGSFPSCSTSYHIGGTICNRPGCTILAQVEKLSNEQCCALAVSNFSAIANAWSNDCEGSGCTCRVKRGSQGYKSGMTNTKSLWVHSGPTPPPTPPPSPLPPAPTPPPFTPPPGAKNVLFIAVDDLRPQLGAYGSSFMKTPHIDELAATGTLFQRAYVQYSFCAPSRNSFLTGRRPDATQAWSFMDHFRERGVGDKWTSLPEYFRRAGYWTVGAGKLFHPGVPPNFDASDAFGNKLSFDEFYYPGSCTGTTNGWPILEPNVTNVECVAATGDCPAKATTAGDGTHWCALDVTKLDAPLQDTLTVKKIVSWLNEAKAKQDADVKSGASKTPFFIGMGLHKPHLPFQYPSTLDGLYPLAEQIAPAKHVNAPNGMPLVAWHEGNFQNKWKQPCPDKQQSIYRRAYYTSVSFTDGNVGEILAELKALGLYDSTVVSLIGDHGWQLGEMNLWRKMTNFELGVRVPLIIRVPWKAASIGVKSPLLVEAVDLFATLVKVAGLPAAPVVENLEGRSFAKVFDDPTSGSLNATFKYAFSQFAKRDMKESEVSSHPMVPWDECTKCTHEEIMYMGLSVREERFRYTEWYTWNNVTDKPRWSNGTYSVELYDHLGDFGEDLDVATATNNLAVGASAADHAAVMARLAAALKAQFQNDYQPPDGVQ